jgi:predicted ATPase
MHDVPARQRSLSATFTSSWQNLPPPAQALFQRLSVFRGTFSAEAASAVASATRPILTILVNKSLLRLISPERYELHEMLRRMAKEKLGAWPDEAVEIWERYQQYYATLVQTTATALANRIDIGQNLIRFNAELDNIWAVWRRNLHHPDLGTALEKIFHMSTYASFLLSGQWNSVEITN